MKNSLLMLLMVFTISSFSQSKIEKYFQNENYFSVIETLKEKERSSSLNLKESEYLALSYYYNNDYASAYPYFNKLMEDSEFKNKYKYHYSHCLKSMGEEVLGNKLLKEYYSSYNNTTYDKNFDDIEVIKRLGERFKIKNEKKLNTEYSDMFSLDYDNRIYISSTRPNNLINSKKYKWNGQPYLDCYYLNKVDSTLTSYNSINTDYHESDFSINKYNGSFYYTSSKPDEDLFLKKDEVINTKIYQALLDNDKIVKTIILPFNSNKYSCRNPFLDYENKRLYFSSNKPGGVGGYDIYYVHLDSPEVMINVKEVNTINDEDNFYIDNKKNIYFASNGYVGFGGKDIFTRMYDEASGEYKRVMNVGLPVNSQYDDFGYQNINDKGYFTSNRKSGKGDDDIYSFVVTKPLELDKIIQVLKGKITDEANNPIANAKVILKNGPEVLEIITDHNGNYQFDTFGNTNYELNVSAKRYKEQNLPIITNSNKYDTQVKDVVLKMLECTQKYSGIIYNDKTGLPLAGATVSFVDTSKKLVATTKTNEKGEYVILAPCGKTLMFKASLHESSNPYFAEYQEWIETDNTYDKEHDKNVELKQVGSRGLISDKFGNILIPTKPIYFAYNSSNVESQSFEELNKVSELLKENPTWNLLIEAHSDMRGTDKYNLSLSIKRAEATKVFLVKTGIAANRIMTNGYGESKPLIDCLTKECTEDEHGINRRSEFIIK